jgi:two-component system, NarL family, response regulator NreC
LLAAGRDANSPAEETTVDRIRILLSDDHALLRETLKLLLNAQPDLEVIGEAGAAAETSRLAAELNPDIILLDITLPDRSGIGLLPELRQLCPSARIIMLSMHEDSTYVRSSLAAGAAGYIGKSSKPGVLLEAIHAVRQGGQFIDPSLRTAEPGPAPPAVASETAPIARLSDRERQVLVWLTQGLRYQAIAERMGVSVKTVETYRSRLTAKLGFKDRADMMRFAIESGILSSPPA